MPPNTERMSKLINNLAALLKIEHSYRTGHMGEPHPRCGVCQDIKKAQEATK